MWGRRDWEGIQGNEEMKSRENKNKMKKEEGEIELEKGRKERKIEGK